MALFLTGSPDGLCVRHDTLRADIVRGAFHHAQKFWILLDLVEPRVHLRIELNRFAHDIAEVTGSVGGKLLQQLVGLRGRTDGA